MYYYFLISQLLNFHLHCWHHSSSFWDTWYKGNAHTCACACACVCVCQTSWVVATTTVKHRLTQTVM